MRMRTRASPIGWLGVLQRNGWQVWIAPDSIRPGERWAEAIKRGLEECGVFVAVLTPAAVKSTWVRVETNQAIGLRNRGRIRFIPLLVAECTPPKEWAIFHWIPFTGRYLSGLNALLRTLNEESGKPAIEREHKSTFLLDGILRSSGLDPITILDKEFTGIMLLDGNLRIAGLNPAAEAIIGLQAEQITGQPLNNVFGPHITDEGSSLHQAVTTGERVAPREETLVCGDRPCDVLLGVSPLGDGFLLSLADITQIKRGGSVSSPISSPMSPTVSHAAGHDQGLRRAAHGRSWRR